MEQLQRQLSGLREEHSCLLTSLKEAHRLIDRHSDSSARSASNEVKIRTIYTIPSINSMTYKLPISDGGCVLGLAVSQLINEHIVPLRVLQR